jgi:transcriptional regulator with XRE-family HTH domain
MSPRKLSHVIKRLRKAKGWNKVELAKAADVTTAYISLLESGKKTNPSLDVLKRLAKALDVPVAELLE